MADDYGEYTEPDELPYPDDSDDADGVDEEDD